MAQGTTTYTYNAGNRLTLITDPDSTVTTNTYDNNGNLTVTNDNGTVTTNTWTYENRLRTVTLATPTTTTFTYDGDGLRRQTVTAAGTTNFIWDGQDVLLETDAGNSTQVTYTQTPNIYGNLVSQRRSTTTKYYHFDALGSTLALTDSGENVTDTYRYFAFGRSLTSTGATVNNFRFVGNLGYYNEAALALQYLRARYYQPSTGRFISVDPVPGYPRDPITLHQYLYAANNALLLTDPSGQKTCRDEVDCWMNFHRCRKDAQRDGSLCVGEIVGRGLASGYFECVLGCLPALKFGIWGYVVCMAPCELGVGLAQIVASHVCGLNYDETFGSCKDALWYCTRCSVRCPRPDDWPSPVPVIE